MSSTNLRLDVGSPAFKRDPHPTYDHLRAHAPIARTRGGPTGTAWVLSRHADVTAMLKDTRLFKDRSRFTARPVGPPLVGPLIAPLLNGMLDKDDPDHARLRRLAQAAFTPRRIERLAGQVEEIADDLLGKLAKRSSFDLISDYAVPLPVVVICDLLGVPPQDRSWVVRGSNAIIALGRSPPSAVVSLPTALGFMGRVRAFIARRRDRPGDDLLSGLIAAQDAEAALSDDELLCMIILLLSAGHETTTNLIGNGVAALSEYPHEAERLRAEPGLAETAVEELLRFAPPVETSTYRFAGEDMDIAGTQVRRGDAVLGLIGSANRDDHVFADPHRLDLGRSANRHLTFGMGGHYCLGAPLARLEGRIAIPALLRRFPGLRRADPSRPLAWRQGLVLRGLKTLPVRV